MQTVTKCGAKMYITGCRAHFYYLPGLGQVGHTQKETSGSAGTLDWGPMWSGSKSTCHPQYKSILISVSCDFKGYPNSI